jgi:hypothetical protein
VRQAGEPSVEEILDSIKKVIARDNRADAAQQRARREVPIVRTGAAAAFAARQSDVLDLSEIAAQILATDRSDMQADVPPSPTPCSADKSFPREGFQPDGEDDMADDEAPLLPESTTASMRDSLATLAMLAEPGAQPQIVRSGETSLEGLVREMLRPMLAEWLDKNLPPVVEKMVAGEIARIVGKKG